MVSCWNWLPYNFFQPSKKLRFYFFLKVSILRQVSTKFGGLNEPLSTGLRRFVTFDSRRPRTFCVASCLHFLLIFFFFQVCGFNGKIHLINNICLFLRLALGYCFYLSTRGVELERRFMTFIVRIHKWCWIDLSQITTEHFVTLIESGMHLTTSNPEQICLLTHPDLLLGA